MYFIQAAILVVLITIGDEADRNTFQFFLTIPSTTLQIHWAEKYTCFCDAFHFGRCFISTK